MQASVALLQFGVTSTHGILLGSSLGIRLGLNSERGCPEVFGPLIWTNLLLEHVSPMSIRAQAGLHRTYSFVSLLGHPTQDLVANTGTNPLPQPLHKTRDSGVTPVAPSAPEVSLKEGKPTYQRPQGADPTVRRFARACFLVRPKATVFPTTPRWFLDSRL